MEMSIIEVCCRGGGGGGNRTGRGNEAKISAKLTAPMVVSIIILSATYG